MCGQLTRAAHELILPLVSNGGDLFMATPPFNMHDYEETAMPRFAQVFSEQKDYNVPVFGPQTTEAVVKLVDRINQLPDMPSCLGTATFRRDAFVINKACESVLKHIISNAALDAMLDAAGNERVRLAKTKMRAFLESCQRALPTSLQDWYAFIDGELGGSSWKGDGALHAQTILVLFGLESDDARVVAGRRCKMVEGTGKEDPTRREEVWRALEWLTKMMSGGYGPAGATSDLVNLVFALTGAAREEPVARVVDAFMKVWLVDGADVGGLRLPTYMVHDGELDDILAWKLLHYLHRRRGTLGAFKVHMQLPGFPALRMKTWRARIEAAAWFDTLGGQMRALGVQTLPDDCSLNAEKVLQNPMIKANGAAPLPLVRTIAAGLTHCVCVSPVNGMLLTWGGSEGQDSLTGHPGHSHDAGANGDTDGGGSPSWALLNTSPAAGVGGASPTRVSLDGHVAVVVSAGRGHSMLVTAAGDAFSWGSSPRGQLGHGGIGAVLLPKQIELKIKLAQVSCGSNHSLLLARSGQLFSCGGDDFGQLGHGDCTDQLQPRQLHFFKDRPVAEASSGAQHSHAVTTTGELFGWGCSHHGRLGVVTAAAHHEPKIGIRTAKAYCGVPQRVQLTGVKHVSGGTHHTLAVLGGGELYSFGCGEAGRLGLGGQDDTWEPRRVTLGAKAVMAAAGTSHSLVLTEDQEVYTFGSGGRGELGHGDRATTLVPQKVAFFSQLKPTDPPGALPPPSPGPRCVILGCRRLDWRPYAIHACLAALLP
jgi:hypothetical protein